MWALCLPGCSMTDGHRVAAWHRDFCKLLWCSTRTVAIRATQHKPGLHVVCGKYHSVLDCNLFSNARYDKSQIKLNCQIFILIHLVQMSLWNKAHPPELFSPPLSLTMCLQGEVVEFLDEFLDEDHHPILEGPPQHWESKTQTTKQHKHSPVCIYWVLYEALIGHCALTCRSKTLNIFVLNLLFCALNIQLSDMDILYSTVAKWLKDGYETRDLNIFTCLFLESFLHCESCLFSCKDGNFFFFLQWNDNKTSGVWSDCHSVVVIVQLFLFITFWLISWSHKSTYSNKQGRGTEWVYTN